MQFGPSFFATARIPEVRTVLGNSNRSPPLFLQPIVDHLKSGMKPVEDWIEDLENISEEISSNKKLSEDSLAILEDILSLLDDQFAEDLQRLYAR